MKPPAEYRTPQEVCSSTEPELREIASGRHVACHFAETPPSVQQIENRTHA